MLENHYIKTEFLIGDEEKSIIGKTVGKKDKLHKFSI